MGNDLVLQLEKTPIRINEVVNNMSYESKLEDQCAIFLMNLQCITRTSGNSRDISCCR